MATTTNGIYYPNDYEKEADVPADMKAMAESIEKNIIPNISNIKAEQKTQNTNISNLQADNNTNKSDITTIKAEQTSQNAELEELRAENERLREDLNALPTGQAEGETIDITDSAEMRFSEFEIRGNSIQDGEPTPDTPVEVESCGDNENLFDKNDVTNGMYINRNSGVISTGSDATNYSTSGFCKVKPNTQCYLGILYSSNNYGVVYYDKNKQYLSGERLANTFTTPDNCEYIRFSWLTNNYNIDEIKLEKGTKETPYSPYGQGCINEVVCNKNLFDEEIESGNINSSGVNYDDSTMIRSKNYIKVKPNENIIISNNGIALQVNIVEYDNHFTFISKKYVNATYLTTSNNTKYIKFVTTTIENPKILIEENTVVTQYVSHQSETFSIPTQQPFRKIGDYADTFVKVNGKWVERHYIERYYFTGGEDFISVTNGSTVLLRTATFSSKIYLDDNTIVVKSNIATGYSNANWKNHRTENIVFGGTNGYIQFILPNITAVEDLKTYLAEQYEAGTPVYIDYVLATPKDIECTAEQIAILDKIYNEAKSYKGVTHIYSTDDVEPNVKVTYKKDLDTMINNLNTAIVAMGGV